MLGGAGKDYSAFSNPDSWFIQRMCCVLVLLLLLTCFANILAINPSFCPVKMSGNDDTVCVFFLIFFFFFLKGRLVTFICI